MSYRLVLLVLIAVVSGCSSTPNNSTLRPNTGTNQVAMTNLNLAIEYMRAGSLETALDRLNSDYEADPKYYGTHNAYGLIYQQLGDPRLAEVHFKKAIELNSNDSLSKNNYGSFLCQSGRFDEAEKIFLSAADNPLYTTPEVAYTNAGNCAVRNGLDDVGEKYLRQALSINPNVATALLQMSQLSYRQESYLSARAYLQRYQAVASHTPSSLLLGINIEKTLGDRNAVSSYEMRLKNSFPDSVEAKELSSSSRP